LLLAQQFQFEEQRKRFEEERTQLVAEKARLVEKQNVIRQQNAKQAKELEENPNLIKRLTKIKWLHCLFYTKNVTTIDLETKLYKHQSKRQRINHSSISKRFAKSVS
jgi:hypothetical protein